MAVTKKLYVGILRDHSASMDWLTTSAKNDYNSLIDSIKRGSDEQDVDTIVYTTRFGVGTGGGFVHEAVNSGVNRLKPLLTYDADGHYTVLWDALADMLDQLSKVPDYNEPNVSFLVLVVTDGEDNHSVKWSGRLLGDRIVRLQRDGNWTVTFRVPRSASAGLVRNGIPAGNILEWNIADRHDFERSSQITQSSVSNYFGSIARGVRSTNSFYADAGNISKAAARNTLVNISSEVKFYTVMNADSFGGKVEIAPFIERRTGSVYVRGTAFYELIKTEKAVQASKKIAIRSTTDGSVYYGSEARNLLGLPDVGTIKLSPGNHGLWDIFIQSTSSNRILPVGSKVMYWPRVR